MTKRKDERKELLKTDEFKAALESGISQTKESPRTVIGAVVGAFALLGLIFLVMSFRDNAAKNAAGQVYQIEGPLFAQVDDTRDRFDFSSERQKYEQALAEAENTIPSLSGAAKQQALLLKAGALAALGRQDEIPAVYEEVLKGDSGYHFFAHKGLGDYHFAKKAFDEALSHYDKLAKSGSVVPDMQDFVNYQRARCFQGKNDFAQARTLANAVIDRYKDKEAVDRSPVYRKVEELLKELDEASPASDAGAAS
ncbi:tetratricopeptide repeat protein [Acanthopleuribacter pedis]|uniref:Tetratricopeptide repeat-like domain-containing protein n=1 Tax=Acanthopleuribacter pedis TaxID=442870 RepID=A0A8J7U3W0_9BACT|nr:hypothetical protein [Acanthopleuribacter pedis]MBO1320012.1 hypothetical protein [Acanthopleuribacter pedis]